MCSFVTYSRLQLQIFSMIALADQLRLGGRFKKTSDAVVLGGGNSLYSTLSSAAVLENYVGRHVARCCDACILLLVRLHW
jgi:hypothetical protein